MNQNYNRINEDEKMFNLIDVCLYILKKWKIIAAVALIAAVVMAGYSALKSYKTYQTAQDAPNVAPVNLTEEEIRDLQVKLQSVEVYENNVNAYQEYLDKSIKCKLDPNGFYEGSVNYMIVLETEEEVLSAEKICEAEIFNSEAYEKLAKELGEDTAASKIGEVLELSTETTITGSNLLMQLSVTARYYTQEGCQKMLDVLSALIESVNLGVVRGDMDGFEKLSENILFTSDSTLIDERQLILNSKTSANTNLNTIKNTITDNQKKYQTWLENNEDSSNVQTETQISIHWMYVIVAAIAGAFCTAGIYGVFYLIGGRVHTKEELESCCQIPVMSLGNGKNDDTLEMIAMLLANYVKSQNIGSFYLSGSLGVRQKDMMEKLEKLLQKKNVKAECGGDILTDVDALQKATDHGCIVFVEKCNETKQKNIRAELEKAWFCDIKVLGIVLEK